MRKKICIFFFIFFMLSINVFASELNLNPDVLKNKDETSSSITDIYKVPVFSDKYKDYIEKKNKEKEEEKKDLLNNLFEDKSSKVKGIYSREKEITELFKENKIINNSIRESKKIKFVPLLFIILFFSISLIIVVTTTQYYKNKKDKDDSNVYHNNFENK